MVLGLVGGLLIVMGALLMKFFLWLGSGSDRVARRGVKVRAEVVASVHEEGGEEDPIYGGGGSGFAPAVRFRTLDGDVVAASSRRVLSGSPRRLPKAGTAMQVRCDPGNPQNIYIHGWDAPSRFMVSGFTAGAVLVMLLGAFFIVLAVLVSTS
jgi:hypothetical protein